MKRLASVLALMALPTLLLPAISAAADKPAACNRACLKSTLDKYLDAMVTHNPSAAPLGAGYRHTENAISVPLGKGLWQSATGLGKMQRRYLDAVNGQAAYYGTLDEGGKVAIVTVRLFIESRKISEAEWYVARNGDPGLPGATPANYWNPDSLTANPPPERALPAGKRMSREAMIGVVHSYFDGIVSHDGSVVIAHDGCHRYENGTRVTGNRGGTNDDCKSGLANFDLANVAARRIPLVDEEAGVVLGLAVFIRRPGSIRPRNAFSEWFVLEDGKIRNIWTAMYYPGPERPVPNWPPFEGNFPLGSPSGAASAPTAPTGTGPTP